MNGKKMAENGGRKLVHESAENYGVQVCIQLNSTIVKHAIKGNLSMLKKKVANKY